MQAAVPAYMQPQVSNERLGTLVNASAGKKDRDGDASVLE